MKELYKDTPADTASESLEKGHEPGVFHSVSVSQSNGHDYDMKLCKPCMGNFYRDATSPEQKHKYSSLAVGNAEKHPAGTKCNFCLNKGLMDSIKAGAAAIALHSTAPNIKPKEDPKGKKGRANFDSKPVRWDKATAKQVADSGSMQDKFGHTREFSKEESMKQENVEKQDEVKKEEIEKGSFKNAMAQSHAMVDAGKAALINKPMLPSPHKNAIMPSPKDQESRASMYDDFMPKGSFSKATEEISFAKNGQWCLEKGIGSKIRNAATAAAVAAGALGTGGIIGHDLTRGNPRHSITSEAKPSAHDVGHKEGAQDTYKAKGNSIAKGESDDHIPTAFKHTHTDNTGTHHYDVHNKAGKKIMGAEYHPRESSVGWYGLPKTLEGSTHEADMDDKIRAHAATLKPAK